VREIGKEEKCQRDLGRMGGKRKALSPGKEGEKKKKEEESREEEEREEKTEKKEMKGRERKTLTLAFLDFL
jgi:hypothetical protein